LAVLTSGPVAEAADISSAQKDGVCRVSLARINGILPSDFKSVVVFGDTRRYKSKSGYIYDCEVFSDGMALTLSNSDWGRLKPTASIVTEGRCSNIKLFDPGFGITHDLKYCSM
jgi:hypothetical protein